MWFCCTRIAVRAAAIVPMHRNNQEKQHQRQQKSHTHIFDADFFFILFIPLSVFCLLTFKFSHVHTRRRWEEETCLSGNNVQKSIWARL